MPPMRPGFSSTAAISVMLSAEVFEAITASAGAAASTSPKQRDLEIDLLRRRLDDHDRRVATASATLVVVGQAADDRRRSRPGPVLPSSTPLLRMRR